MQGGKYKCGMPGGLPRLISSYFYLCRSRESTGTTVCFCRQGTGNINQLSPSTTSQGSHSGAHTEPSTLLFRQVLPWNLKQQVPMILPFLPTRKTGFQA